jgi:hypothetical protein
MGAPTSSGETGGLKEQGGMTDSTQKRKRRHQERKGEYIKQN